MSKFYILSEDEILKEEAEDDTNGRRSVFKYGG